MILTHRYGGGLKVGIASGGRPQCPARPALTVLKSHRRLVSLTPAKAATSECLLRAKIAEVYLRLNDHPKALEHLEKVDVGGNSQLEPSTARAATGPPVLSGSSA